MSADVREKAGAAVLERADGDQPGPRDMTAAPGLGAQEWRLILTTGQSPFSAGLGRGRALCRGAGVPEHYPPEVNKPDETVIDKGIEECLLRAMRLAEAKPEGWSTPDKVITSSTPTIPVTIKSAVTASEWESDLCDKDWAESLAGSYADILARIIPGLETHEPSIEYEPAAAAFIDNSDLGDERSRAERILQTVFNVSDSIAVSLEHDADEEDAAPSLVLHIATDMSIMGFRAARRRAYRQIAEAGCERYSMYLAMVRA